MSHHRLGCRYCMCFSDSAFIGVRDPNFFSNAGLKYGYVRRANGFRDLPIVGTLNKYDVKEGDRLWMRLGRSDKTVSGTVISLCYSAAYLGDYLTGIVPFVPVMSCHVALDTAEVEGARREYAIAFGRRVAGDAAVGYAGADQ